MRRVAVAAVCSVLLAALILLPKLHDAFAQLATSAWPMFHHDAVHTGLSTVSTGGNNGTLRWKFEIGESAGSQFISSPAIGADGTVYVGSFDDNVYAINPDGSQKWMFTTGDSVESSPAIGADGTIYVGSFDDKVYAINPDGSQKWTFATRCGGVLSRDRRRRHHLRRLRRRQRLRHKSERQARSGSLNGRPCDLCRPRSAPTALST